MRKTPSSDPELKFWNHIRICDFDKVISGSKKNLDIQLLGSGYPAHPYRIRVKNRKKTGPNFSSHFYFSRKKCNSQHFFAFNTSTYVIRKQTSIWKLHNYFHHHMRSLWETSYTSKIPVLPTYCFHTWVRYEGGGFLDYRPWVKLKSRTNLVVRGQYHANITQND